MELNATGKTILATGAIALFGSCALPLGDATRRIVADLAVRTLLGGSVVCNFTSARTNISQKNFKEVFKNFVVGGTSLFFLFSSEVWPGSNATRPFFSLDMNFFHDSGVILALLGVLATCKDEISSPVKATSLPGAGAPPRTRAALPRPPRILLDIDLNHHKQQTHREAMLEFAKNLGLKPSATTEDTECSNLLDGLGPLQDKYTQCMAMESVPDRIGPKLDNLLDSTLRDVQLENPQNILTSLTNILENLSLLTQELPSMLDDKKQIVRGADYTYGRAIIKHFGKTPKTIRLVERLALLVVILHKSNSNPRLMTTDLAKAAHHLLIAARAYDKAIAASLFAEKHMDAQAQSDRPHENDKSHRKSILFFTEATSAATKLANPFKSVSEEHFNPEDERSVNSAISEFANIVDQANTAASRLAESNPLTQLSSDEILQMWANPSAPKKDTQNMVSKAINLISDEIQRINLHTKKLRQPVGASAAAAAPPTGAAGKQEE
ncbi:MAG: hypothetical protein P0S96_06095 [Simkaniaceae bacterium]|nr:hypothetical protein [Candidatus Sacchlamyda saccharinae]